jgi:hypothetical protein
MSIGDSVNFVAMGQIITIFGAQSTQGRTEKLILYRGRPLASRPGEDLGIEEGLQLTGTGRLLA